MSRDGMNQLRLAKIPGYGPVVVGAITHLPNMDGYHADRFEVIKASLDSMRRNAGMDCEIMVWDNGSCIELLHWLINVYRPDYMMMSRNIGKANARSGMVRMLPPSTIVGVADDDMYYYPDWLLEQVNILQHFPNVGQVSGYPVRTQQRWGNKRTLEWAQNHANLNVGKFIPEEYDRDFCTSIGRDYAFHLTYTDADKDYLITYRGKQAYGVAHHCQWIGYAGVMAPFCRWDLDAMGDEKPFDNAVDEAGLLRLTTVTRYTRHIGNKLDADLKNL